MKRQKQNKNGGFKPPREISFAGEKQLEKLLIEGLESPCKPMTAARKKRLYQRTLE